MVFGGTNNIAMWKITKNGGLVSWEERGKKVIVMMVTSFNLEFGNCGERVGGKGGGKREEGEISNTMRVQVLASIH